MWVEYQNTGDFHASSDEWDVLLSLSLSLTACSFSSRGLPPPKMDTLAVDSARSLTSLLTERGLRFNLGLERRSSRGKGCGLLSPVPSLNIYHIVGKILGFLKFSRFSQTISKPGKSKPYLGVVFILRST